MGLFTSSSSQTQKSTAADLSPQGIELDELWNQMMAEQMSSMGYDLNIKTEEVFKDKNKAEAVQLRLEQAQAKYDAAKAALDSLDKTKPNYDIQYQKYSNQMIVAQQGVDREKNNLAKIGKTTVHSYDLVKKEDPRVQQAIDKYGPDSKQVTDIRATLKQEEVFEAESQAEVTKNYLTNLKKFTAGDLSYTEEQKTQVDKLTKPIKTAINKMADDLLDKYKDDYVSMSKELSNVGKEITKTNFDIMSALSAASVQIEKSGANLMTILKDVNEKSEAKAMFQFDLMSKQIDEEVDNQNAMLGLPPNSQSALLQKADKKNQAMKYIQLDLAEQTAKGTMSIASDVESGKKQISFQRVALAQSTGDKREQLAKYGVDLLGSYLGKEQQTIGVRDTELLNLEKTKAEQLYNLSTGNIQNMISAGQSGLAFDKSMTAQDLQAMGGMVNQANVPLSFEKNKQLYEGTTKTTGTSTKSPFDAMTDVASVVTGGASFGTDMGWWNQGKKQNSSEG